MYNQYGQGLLGLGSNIANGPTQQWGSTDLTGNLGAMPTAGGYSQQAIDAYNALQQPTLDKTAAARRASLAAQGVTNGSVIGSSAERDIGNMYSDAANKAVLSGLTQGNTEFQQSLAARQQGYTENLGTSNLANAIRQAQSGEDIAGFNALQTARQGVGAPKFDSFASATTAAAPQTYQAGVDTFNAYQAQSNAAAQAAAANRTANQGLLSTGISALGGLSGIGGLLSGAGSFFGGGGGSSGGWDAYDYGMGGGGGTDNLSGLLNMNNAYGTAPS
jgi:hypothetical protein